MGTRADFYVGRSKDAIWLGSIAHDGYPGGILDGIIKAKSEEEFRGGVNDFLSARDDATFPKDGWPWPWDDSNTTDYAYCFLDGKTVWNDGEEMTLYEYPDMSKIKNVTLGPRSGLFILRVKEK